MDDLDRKILSLLAHNARMPVKEIAERVALTSPAVSSRIHKLEADGVISGYTVVLNRPAGRLYVDALISLSVAPSEREGLLNLLQNSRNALSLLQTGDFRSPECVELLKEADIVVTNPPFSLFREYIGQLMEYGKKFLIVGHQNAITYKEVFPLIKENRVWLGYGFKGAAAHFFSPYEDTATAGDHRKNMIRVSGVTWYTNLDIPKRNEELDLVRRYSAEEYPKYEDYDAIDVSDSLAVPMDYDGIMGVPITFLNVFNPSQFEIIDCCEPCIRLDILRKMPKFKEYKSRQKKCNGHLCQKKYHRLLIRNKNPKTI